ncbi:MAG: HEPN domain-containing protein [Anaerolineae bacterium]|nr:HEPN domain-containing protein [Anaerolineae bacterium]
MMKDGGRRTKDERRRAKDEGRRTKEQRAAYRASKTRHLTRTEIQAIEQFRARLHQILRADQIKSLILYGSKARGDAHRKSDVDLLLVYENVTPAQKEEIETVTDDLFAQPRPQVHVLTYPLEEVRRNAELGMPLFVNIARDGKTIEGEPLMVNPTDKPTVSRMFIESARKRLHSAQVLIDAGEYRDSISRSYYAVLDAADAALIIKGITPHSHEGTLVLFSVHFVKKGLVQKDFGVLFKRMRKARQQADYSRQIVFTKEDAEYWFALAREFVETIEQSLPKWLEES